MMRFPLKHVHNERILRPDAPETHLCAKVQQLREQGCRKRVKVFVGITRLVVVCPVKGIGKGVSRALD
jgi:hypothetical protein